MKEEWLFRGALVPIDAATTAALVAEIKRLIDVVGGMALAQPEQEPVAYCYVQKGTSVDILTFDDAPDDAVDGTIFPLYTTPPKRPWVGLTDEEIIAVDMYTLRVRGDGYTYARAIEAKLKELNI